MLLFCDAPEDKLRKIRRAGLPAGMPCWTSLEQAQAQDPGCVLVINALALVEAGADVPLKPGAGQVEGPAVPARFIQNLDPYRPPVPVSAAGGYVVRARGEEPEVLLIFRRGVWDLPKGKQEPEEDAESCAQREVCEEVGISAVELVRALGATQHGYPEQDQHCVKTTHWFLMRTEATDFTPQGREDIERVRWMPWQEAKQHIGYDTLRWHMERVEAPILAQARTWTPEQ